MTILLVDDEPSGVESIEALIDWEVLGIRRVLRAHSMQQAQAVLEEEDVDILLSGIDTPQGSGLDLVEWLRERGGHSVCLLLTGSSEFEYASRAIKLGVFEYLLKPVDSGTLAQALERAAKRAKQERERSDKLLHGEFWEEQRLSAVTAFWDDLTNETIAPDAEAIRRALDQRHLLPEPFGWDHYLLLLRVLPGNGSESWPRNLLEYAMKNILAELISPIIFPKGPDAYMVFTPDKAFPGRELFKSRCEEALAALREALPAEFLAYCCGPLAAEHASSAFRLLDKDAATWLSGRSAFLFHQELGPAPLAEIDTEAWRQSLAAQNAAPILAEIDRVISPPGDFVEKRQLAELHRSLVNTVIAVLKLYGFPSDLLENGPSTESFFRAIHSVPSFSAWAEGLLEQTISRLAGHEQATSVVETVRAYIRTHTDSEITRGDIAAHVHFHPDYLSHIFRKQTGMSLSEFILRERINIARDLLLSTSLPVREIAIRAGFQNVSYFSMQFKRFVGLTPVQYRKEYKG